MIHRPSFHVSFDPCNKDMVSFLGKCIPDSLYVSWSVVYSEIQLWEGGKLKFQREKEFEKFQTHF